MDRQGVGYNTLRLFGAISVMGHNLWRKLSSDWSYMGHSRLELFGVIGNIAVICAKTPFGEIVYCFCVFTHYM